MYTPTGQSASTSAAQHLQMACQGRRTAKAWQAPPHRQSLAGAANSVHRCALQNLAPPLYTRRAAAQHARREAPLEQLCLKTVHQIAVSQSCEAAPFQAGLPPRSPRHDPRPLAPIRKVPGFPLASTEPPLSPCQAIPRKLLSQQGVLGRVVARLQRAEPQLRPQSQHPQLLWLPYAQQRAWPFLALPKPTSPESGALFPQRARPAAPPPKHAETTAVTLIEATIAMWGCLRSPGLPGARSYPPEHPPLVRAPSEVTLPTSLGNGGTQRCACGLSSQTCSRRCT